ncbi:MAG: DUF371 domain-containing protein [Cenarchaeum sp. SB0664_bin_35]|nr:DUF371 domain-containing protein [Cenarchaeum sp. SB0664_bin_35]
MPARCIISFSGHKNVRATHKTTIEITTDESLSVRGDCIVGVSSAMGCLGLPHKIRDALQNDSSMAHIMFNVQGNVFAVRGRGSSRLTLMDSHDIVLRKSDFACPRTLIIGCSAASIDMPRRMVQSLREGADGIMEMTVYAQGEMDI